MNLIEKVFYLKFVFVLSKNQIQNYTRIRSFLLRQTTDECENIKIFILSRLLANEKSGLRKVVFICSMIYDGVRFLDWNFVQQFLDY